MAGWLRSKHDQAMSERAPLLGGHVVIWRCSVQKLLVLGDLILDSLMHNSQGNVLGEGGLSACASTSNAAITGYRGGMLEAVQPSIDFRVVAHLGQVTKGKSMIGQWQTSIKPLRSRETPTGWGSRRQDVPLWLSSLPTSVQLAQGGKRPSML
jgi:hypothetical protein